MRADQHVHSYFSGDADSSPEEMVNGAAKKGLSLLCFTDHYDKGDLDWGEEFIFDIKDYLTRMQEVQEKYQDQMQIRIGIELGLQPHLSDFYHTLVAEHSFDLVIGSVHSVAGEEIATGHIFEGQTDEEAYHQILKEMIEDVKASSADFDVLGHLDYMTRYGTGKEPVYSYARFADEIDTILRLLIENGKGLEVNTSGLKYGLPYMHPHMDVLRRYRELGGEIVTVGSDAHAPDQIAYDFEQISDVLEACGFRYYAEFTKRTPKFARVT